MAPLLDLLSALVFGSEGPQTGVSAGEALFSSCAVNQTKAAGRDSFGGVYFYAVSILHELYLAFPFEVVV